MDTVVLPLLSLADQLDHRALPLTMGSVVWRQGGHPMREESVLFNFHGGGCRSLYSRPLGLGAAEVRCEHPGGKKRQNRARRRQPVLHRARKGA